MKSTSAWILLSQTDFSTRCSYLPSDSGVAMPDNKALCSRSLPLALCLDRRTALTEKPMCDRYT
jgi:hypothetical protein